MTEKQILKKIDAWDDVDNIQAIVDFVEKLPAEQQTTPVLSELGRAYNNLYWLDQTADNRKHLEQAVRVFKYLEPELSEDASWNYRIGYSYFYLGDGENAKKHFLKERSLNGSGNDVETYLDCIEMAAKKGISCVEIYEGGKAEVEYPLEMFLDFLSENAPNLRSKLTKKATKNELDAFEKELGAELPAAFRQLHETFSGQNDLEPFFATGMQHFVSLSQIKNEQKRWKNFVEEHFGKNWQNIALDEENATDSFCIKNTLFNEKWLPLLAGDDFFICLDLDPHGDAFTPAEENYGQIISVTIAPEKEDYFVSYLFSSIKDWVGYINRQLLGGGLVYNQEENLLQFPENEPIGTFAYDEEEKSAVKNYLTSIFGTPCKSIPSEEEAVELEILVFPPTADRNHYTLATCGMGSYAQNVPYDYPYTPFGELLINLPPSWNPNDESEENFWAVFWLMRLAYLPLYQGTFLGFGHTVPMGEPIIGTNFDCLMLVMAVIPSENTQPADYQGDEEENNSTQIRIELPEERLVEFWYVVPLYPEETLFKLDHSADELLDRFSEANFPYPPVFQADRANVCEGYEPAETPTALENIAWAFKGVFYHTLMEFWQSVRRYNDDIENEEIEYFTPFSNIFASPKVKLIYEAFIKNEEFLQENERVLNSEVFEEAPDEDGLYFVRILAELETDDANNFGSLNLLRHINNILIGKELGDRIFFEGIDVEGYEEDGTPVVFLNLGS